jgi:phospholipid/cholesterol/gamma-HCH transport system ATP-binding protein
VKEITFMQEPVIEAENIAVKYGEKTVLSDITVQIFPQEISVILGTSGCGKSTFLKTCIGLIKQSSGTLRIFGREIDDMDSPQAMGVLEKVGVLFQNGALLGSLTVAENVSLPLELHTVLAEGVIDELVQYKLAQVGLSHAYSLYPGELSGGMRKRAALARALALDPPLLLCDEPSAGLDPVTSAGLDELLLQLRKTLGITIVVVTHELMSIEAIADRIIFLSKGEVIYNGSLKDALAFTEGPVHDFFSRNKK